MSAKWGTPTWTLFHAIAEQIPDDLYNVQGENIYKLFRRVCSILPCPDCQKHARVYLKRHKFAFVTTRERFRDFLVKFHNEVNKRKRKPMYEYDPEDYKSHNILHCCQVFTENFKGTGTQRTMLDIVPKRKLMKDIELFISTYF